MSIKLQSILMLFAVLLTSGCGFVHDEKLVGPYRLVAVDTDDQMMICWSPPNSDGDCLGIGLPNETVYAAGFDSKYIIAAVHPTSTGSGEDKSVTRYYYIVRSPDEWRDFPYDQIKGPLSNSQFDAAKAALHLPEFSRVFEDLR